MTHTLGAAGFLSVLVALSLLTGCFSLNAQYPKKQHYVIEAARPVHLQAPTDHIVIAVRTFHISPQFEGMGLIYRKSDLTYATDFYHAFFAAPGALMSEATRDWLAQAGLFQHVVDAASPLEATYLLDGRVNALYGDDRDPNVRRAVLELQVFLIHDQAARTDIVWEHTYRQDVLCKDRSVEALIRGWNDGLRRILSALEIDLKATKPTMARTFMRR